MLCTSEPAFAQDARHTPSAHSSTSSNPYTTTPRIPLLHDPYDPRIDKEYEQLVQDWTQQLLAKSRRQHDAVPIPSSKNNSSHHMDIIEHYLDEQWTDSQHMLKCAQAWSGRDSLSLAEAVRAMNIVSLRLMQRTLDTRHMLNSYVREEGYTPMFSPWDHDTDSDGSIQWRPSHHSPSLASLPKHPVVQDAPKGMVANTDSTLPRISLALSVGDFEEEDEHEMHAPLLRRYQTNSTETSVSDWTHDKLKKRPSLQTIGQQAAAALSPPSRRPVRLAPSPSAPSYSSLADEQCFNTFAPATNYHRYYRHWHEVESIDEHKNEEEWKSWFTQHDHRQPSCAFCYNPVPKKSMSAGDAEDTRLMDEDNQSTSYHTALDKTEEEAKLTRNDKFSDSGKYLSEDQDDAYNALVNSYGLSNTIVRSESSISAFRPISKNLAPRCISERDSLSSSASSIDEQEPFNSKIPTITKSQSFPSKVAGFSNASPRPALPSMTLRHEGEKGTLKERNFVMRSIVSKKASLSKLFSAKK